MDFTPELTPNENDMQNVVKNSANTAMKTVGLILMVSLAATAAAMPTQDELSKAGPLIQELMRDDLAAMRNGKRTREQVGDTAAALAKEAQSPAEKYLLLTTAFDQYMRGGSYDKANTSLVDLRLAIPDWKHADEYTLIEKSLRILAAGKGGPVRERYEALKERQQYAARLRKALAQAKSKPADKKLQLQIAAYYAVLEYWPQAVDAFLAGSNPNCAAAAKLEKESAAPGKVADAWWAASDINPEFLSGAIRAHAADLYKKAIAANSLAGLQKVAAEKRIAEVESAAEIEGVTVVAPKKAGGAKLYDEELDYLESDGGQWIETGVGLSLKGRYTVEIKVSYMPDAAEMDFWGNFGSDNAILVGQFGGLVFGYNKGTPRIDGKPEKDFVTHVIKLEINGAKRSLFVDGSCVGTAAYAHSGAPLSLFSGGKSYKCARVRIHYFKIIRDGKSQLEMVPVSKSGLGFMYDKVSKKLFDSASSCRFSMSSR